MTIQELKEREDIFKKKAKKLINEKTKEVIGGEFTDPDLDELVDSIFQMVVFLEDEPV